MTDTNKAQTGKTDSQAQNNIQTGTDKKADDKNCDTTNSCNNQ